MKTKKLNQIKPNKTIGAGRWPVFAAPRRGKREALGVNWAKIEDRELKTAKNAGPEAGAPEQGESRQGLDGKGRWALLDLKL